ncbi:hypothetical protein OG689_10595 [Kitasatospora sp. NBC_00240]|uniref:hypothetical protein n=1 Tax=Kitasatospora sp. NBC_00240 TaxID=2903567 RepID=UPI00225C288A|nr:hypothetical protein [Kitasatospora sp. NBC_00240]MCX5209731.1 hypothetical protein [Kitasatospora sp. NBC_00240]
MKPSQPELTIEQWKRRALRAEGAIRHALWMSPFAYPKAETAAQMRDRFHQHIEATYPDLITRYSHQPIEVYKRVDACGCEDDGSDEYENDHSEPSDDDEYVCIRSYLGQVCEHCENEDGDGPEWKPYAVEWPCPLIREINATPSDAEVLAASLTPATTT